MQVDSGPSAAPIYALADYDAGGALLDLCRAALSGGSCATTSGYQTQDTQPNSGRVGGGGGVASLRAAEEEQRRRENNNNSNSSNNNKSERRRRRRRNEAEDSESRSAKDAAQMRADAINECVGSLHWSQLIDFHNENDPTSQRLAQLYATRLGRLCSSVRALVR